MELTKEMKALLLKTVEDLKGNARSMFMAHAIQALDEGGQKLAKRDLG